MAEPSNTNPKKTVNLQVTPTFSLKQSLKSLKDFEFNPKGTARVDITESGFQLTVINPVTKTVGYLFMDSARLINFHCSKPVVNKVINLHDIPVDFLGLTGEDSVTIFHRDVEDCLFIIFGGLPRAEFPVEFLRIGSEIGKFPDIKHSCEALWTTETLRQMIEHLEKTGTSQQVLVDISENFLSVFIGNKHPWIKRSTDDDKVITWGMEPGKHHHAWLKVHHLCFLKKALLVTPFCLIGFLTEPASNVMIRFSLGEYGDLVWIHKVDVIVNSDDFVQLGVKGRFTISQNK